MIVYIPLLILILLIAYPLIIYPLTLFFIPMKILQPRGSSHKLELQFSIVCAFYNNERIIKKKLNNLFKIGAAYNVKYYLINDGSTDNTLEELNKYSNKNNVFIYNNRNNIGKSASINRVLDDMDKEIDFILFTDSDTILNDLIIDDFMEVYLNESDLGIYSGSLKTYSNEGGESKYWKIERLIKLLESRSGSVITGNGNFYIIKKSIVTKLDLYSANDAQHFIDARIKGYSIKTYSQLDFFDTTTKNNIDEYKRKERIIIRTLRLLSIRWTEMSLYLKFQWISHKILRWFIPLEVMLLILFVNIILLICYPILFVISIFMTMLTYYTSTGQYILTLSVLPISAFIKFIRGERISTWSVVESRQISG